LGGGHNHKRVEKKKREKRQEKRKTQSAKTLLGGGCSVGSNGGWGVGPKEKALCAET